MDDRGSAYGRLRVTAAVFFPRDTGRRQAAELLDCRLQLESFFGAKYS